MKDKITNRPVQVMIIGAEKAGTTSLFRYLAQHPDVVTHPQQEMTYFTYNEEFSKGYPAAFSRYFSTSNVDEKKYLMAKHVMVLSANHAITRLQEHNPNMHLIIVLRNPVDRAYSSYWYGRRIGRVSHKSFEDALEAETMDVNREWGEWCVQRYIYNGLYAEHLQWIYKKFPHRQVQVVLTDDLKRNSQTVCKEIFESFGLSPFDGLVVGTQHNSAAQARSEIFARLFNIFLQSRFRIFIRKVIPNSLSYRMRYWLIGINSKPANIPPMSPDTRKKLLSFFQPHNDKLASLLGRNLSCWNK